MCFRFELQIAFCGIVAEIILQGSLDIDGMRVVAFDQVAVIAVHRAHRSASEDSRLYGRLRRKPADFCASSRARSVSAPR